MRSDYFTLPGVYFGPDTGGARGRMKATRVDHDKFGLSFKLNATSLFFQPPKQALSGRTRLPAHQTFNPVLINGACSLFFISLACQSDTYHG